MNNKILLQSTIVALGLEGAIQAQTWDYGAATQNWTDALNWSGDVIPQTAATTVNRATAGETPIITTGVALNAFDTFIGNGAAGVLDINAGGSLNTSTKWIFVGNGTNGNGTLNVNAGGSFTSDNDLRLGTSPATGFLNVNGGTVSVARVVSGTLGTISVSNGGKLTTTGVSTSNGAPDIVRLTTSSFGTGSLVSSARDVSFAAGTSSIGGGTVSAARDVLFAAGGNSNITGGALNAGRDIRFGAGTNNLATGSVAATGQVFVGQGGGTSILEMTSGTLSTGAWLVVGIDNGSNGTLNVSGGTVNSAQTSGFTTIGANGTAIGLVRQTGGTWNQTNKLVLGEGGTANGTYTLDGGTLNSPLIQVGLGGTASGTLNVNGGDLNTAQIAGGPGISTINLNGGTIHATADSANFINRASNVLIGGAKIDSNGFAINITGNLSGVGALEKSGTGSLSLSGAANSVSAATVSAGTLFISGALATTNGITVGSTATIGAGDVDGGLITGNLTLNSGATIDITQGVLTVASGGVVSFGGFGFDDIGGFDVQTAAAGTYAILAGSFTLDSTNISNFGSGNALEMTGGRSAYFEEGSLSVVVIPEPSAAILAGFGALALLRRRRI